MGASEAAQAIARRSKSSFYYSFLFLPREQREAIYTFYAFCRLVDDTVDRAGDGAEKARALARWRDELLRVYGGRPEHPVAVRLQEAVRRFRIPGEYLEEIIAGVEMDLTKTRYETFEELSRYCYRVASAVGLICIEIFGYSDQRAREYARHLGTALQLTNILRDLRADGSQGRVYLPQEEIRRFGYPEEDLLACRYTPAFVELMGFQCARAREYFTRARMALPRADRRRLFAAEIMGEIYWSLLRAIEGRGYDVFRSPVVIPRYRKLGLALGIWLRSRLLPDTPIAVHQGGAG